MKLTFLVVYYIAISVAEDVTPPIQEIRSGNLLFTANVYKELSKLGNSDFLVCPLSVSVVLALVEAGAGGKTAEQLRTGLKLPDTSEKTQEAYKSVSPSLNIHNEYTLTSANKIYLKNGFNIKPQFQQVATNVFNAEVENIDFSKDEAVSEINEWISKHTDNKIKDIITRRDLHQETRAVLVNALYFNGDWVKPFKPERTKVKGFHKDAKEQVQVNMMDQTSEFNYYEDDNLKAKFLEMSYKGGDVSMTFVLPNTVSGLAVLEENINEVLKTPPYTSERVHVQIPTFNEEHTFNFIPILQNLGINEVFVPTANLSGIGEYSESLYVSKVIQKTFIDVTDKGTTAAAATVVMVLPGRPAPPPLPPKEFNAKHPFIYYIKYRYGILFIGRFVGTK